MKKRQWAILAGLAILGVAVLLMWVLKNTTEDKMKKKPRVAQGVEVLRVKNTTVPVFIKIDGPLRAQNKIQLFAEVNGILQPGARPFEAGISFKRGETLLQLESSEARSAYSAAKNQYISTLAQVLPDIKLDYPEEYEQWKNYLNSASGQGETSAPPLPENDKLRLFLTGRGVYSNYENLRSTRIRVGKYQITAPFDGVLTEAMVETGSLVRPGQPLGEFIEQGKFEMVATVGSQEIEMISIGDTVHLSSPDSRKEWIGKVYRTNAKVDPSTMRTQIFVQVSGPQLRDGMYLSGKIRGQEIENAFRLPRKLIFNENSLYVVQDSVLQQQQINIVHHGPETVVAQNMPEGTVLPANPVPGAYPGMPVKILNP